MKRIPLFVSVLVIVAWIPLVSAADEVVLVPDADGVQRATMTVDSYFYKPDHLVVRAGTPGRAHSDQSDHLHPAQLCVETAGCGHGDQ